MVAFARRDYAGVVNVAVDNFVDGLVGGSIVGGGGCVGEVGALVVGLDV